MGEALRYIYIYYIYTRKSIMQIFTHRMRLKCWQMQSTCYWCCCCVASAAAAVAATVVVIVATVIIVFVIFVIIPVTDIVVVVYLTPSAFSQNMFCISECECEYGFKDAFEHDHENGSCTGMWMYVRLLRCRIYVNDLGRVNRQCPLGGTCVYTTLKMFPKNILAKEFHGT